VIEHAYPDEGSDLGEPPRDFEVIGGVLGVTKTIPV
jgi:hypothetical protein